MYNPTRESLELRVAALEGSRKELDHHIELLTQSISKLVVRLSDRNSRSIRTKLALEILRIKLDYARERYEAYTARRNSSGWNAVVEDALADNIRHALLEYEAALRKIDGT